MSAGRDDFRDDALARAIRGHGAEMPPSSADDAIRAAARRAVGSQPRAEPALAEAREPWRWWMPLAAAATIGAIAIGVIQSVPRDAIDPGVISDAPVAVAPGRDAAKISSPSNAAPPPANRTGSIEADAMSKPRSDASGERATLTPPAAAGSQASTPSRIPRAPDEAPREVAPSRAAPAASTLADTVAAPPAANREAPPAVASPSIVPIDSEAKRRSAETPGKSAAETAGATGAASFKKAARDFVPDAPKNAEGRIAVDARSTMPSAAPATPAPAPAPSLQSARSATPPIRRGIGADAPATSVAEAGRENRGAETLPGVAGAQTVPQGAGPAMRDRSDSTARLEKPAGAQTAEPSLGAAVRQAQAPESMPPSPPRGAAARAPVAGLAQGGARPASSASASGGGDADTAKAAQVKSFEAYVNDIRRHLAAGDLVSARRELAALRASFTDADERLPDNLKAWAAGVPR